MDENHADPFAQMFLQAPHSSSQTEEVKPVLDDTVINSTYEETYHEIKNESDVKIEYENHDEYEDSKFHSGEETFMDTSQVELMSPDNSQVEAPTQVKRGKGRPRGAKNGTGPRAGVGQRRAVVNELKTTQVKALPKMKPNIHHLKIGKEEAQELKKLPSFCQPGVCFQIAPNLDKCKECLKYMRKMKNRRQGEEVECRFFQFRKLKYENDELKVAGFLNPESDPAEVDRSIWMPNADKRFKTMAAQDALMILSHVGEQLCPLLKKEKGYYEKYKSDDKPVIWKRLIDGVIEICDLCSTTLFNYHFICTRCGLSLCIDCVKESEDGTFENACSTKEKHKVDDLCLTQIIVGDCMEVLQKALHETCSLWDIDHHCELMIDKAELDEATMNIVRNEHIELKTGKSVVARELLHGTSHVDVELDKIVIEPPKEADDVDESFDEYFKKFRKESASDVHYKPIKHTNTLNKETVLSISRSVSQAASQRLHPDVPHRWLCENKLLRLLDPLNKGNEEFFHQQWQCGQPVLISNVLDNLQQELWIPEAFSAEFGHETSDLINCMTGNVVRNREISSFWDGFEDVSKRLKDNEGRAMLLKLKDWPPDSDFKNIMPSRFEDIMKNLPLNSYTNRTGDLNIVKYLPNCFLHPDLGPKGYFAYGSPFFLKEGTTNLHLDISDACNVMCFIGFPRDEQITIDQYIEQGFQAILEADCDFANINRVIEDGEVPGAIWHIYEACDADRIRDFLLKIAFEKGRRVGDDHDVIHDQNWYLDGELRGRLYKEYGVKGYAIIQCLGDCVVLPAGTPHQVRNIYSCIKIAEDFVSPQQVAHCLHLSAQFRKLTKTHTNNEEKLNIKNVAYHSVKEAIGRLDNVRQRRTNFVSTFNDKLEKQKVN